MENYKREICKWSLQLSGCQLLFRIGQRLSNAWEVRDGHEVTVEIMDVFYDTEDDEINYVIKCRKANGGWGWYVKDELDLRSEAHLDKYWQLVKESE